MDPASIDTWASVIGLSAVGLAKLTMEAVQVLKRVFGLQDRAAFIATGAVAGLHACLLVIGLKWPGTLPIIAAYVLTLTVWTFANGLYLHAKAQWGHSEKEV